VNAPKPFPLSIEHALHPGAFHEWRPFRRYSWTLALPIQVGERCRLCGLERHKVPTFPYYREGLLDWRPIAEAVTVSREIEARRAETAAIAARRPRRRLRACVEAWPDAESGAYDPACCRFPKSCSATVVDDGIIPEAELEPAPTRPVPTWCHVCAHYHPIGVPCTADVSDPDDETNGSCGCRG
jgi:hypothetical protein